MITGAAIVVLYHPDAQVLDNIKSYLHWAEALFAIDNSEIQNTAFASSVRTLGPKLQYVWLGKNIGFAAALNQGMDMAHAGGYYWVLTMDQDSRFPKGGIEELAASEVLTDYCTVGICAPLQLTMGIAYDRTRYYERLLTVMTSGNLLNTEAYRKVGRFRDDFFIDMVDHEYCLRLNNHGYSVIRNNHAFLHHSLGMQERTWMGAVTTHHSPVRRYYQTRNRLQLIREWWKQFPAFSIDQLLVLCKEALKILCFEREKAAKLKNMAKGAMAFLRGQTGAISGQGSMTNPVRILLVVFEPRFSGQGRAVCDIVENAGNGFRFDLICQKSNSGLRERLQGRVDSVLAVSKTLNFSLWKAWRWAKPLRSGCMHLHGFEGLVWGSALSALLRLPLIHTPHTIDMKNQALFRLFRMAWKILAQRVRMTVLVSNTDRQTLISRGICTARNCLTIYLGVRKPDTKGDCLRVVPPIPRIIHVGQLSYQKAPELLVKAANRLREKKFKFQIEFIGNGPLRGALESDVNTMGLENHITFSGHVTNVHEKLTTATVEVITSRWEGLPFSLVDAMRYGVPVIASRVNGVLDLVEDRVSGYLFKSGDLDGLVANLEEVLQNPEKAAKIGRAGRDRIQGLFDMEDMAENHRKLYRSIACSTEA